MRIASIKSALTTVMVLAALAGATEASASCHGRKTTGTLIGGASGALIGNSVSGHGSKFGGTLIGAGVGAVAGHAIADHRKGDC